MRNRKGKWLKGWGRIVLLLCVLSPSARAYTLLPSEMKGWSWFQSTVLAGIGQPSKDLGVDLLLPVPNSRKELPIRFWKSAQPNTKGLFLILPGTGGGASSGISNVLAELVASLGYDSLVLANPFSPEFQKSFSADGLVGLPQKDAVDAHRMFEAAVELYRHNRGQPRKLFLMGSSLGGLYAILENGQSPALPFDKLIALNPPVSLNYAMDRLDDMIRLSLRNADSVPDLHFELIWAYLQAQEGISREGVEAIRMFLPAEEEKGQKVIGESFQQSLKAITRGLFAAYPDFFSGERRGRVEASLRSVTFEKYIVYAGAALDGRGRTSTNFSALIQGAGLNRALKNTRNSKIHVITSVDDFLLRPRDLASLEETLGSRLHVFEAGGHCGNYWTASFKKTLAGILR
ncbi:MAG: hypothetical protein AB7K68_00620 [Bacteriovoracia bacterium]